MTAPLVRAGELAAGAGAGLGVFAELPSQMLNARFAVVEFTGREREARGTAPVA